MPIGVAKFFGTQTVVSANYAVQIVPSFVSIEGPNGSTKSGLLTANVSNFVGPLTYLWESTDPQVTVDDPAEPQTRLSAAGYNDILVSNITCTVTDIGQASAQTSDMISATFTFGNPFL